MVTPGFYTIDDRRMYAEVEGDGSPTVVIEVGSTMPGTTDPGWQPIRAALALETCIFTYDRANLGKSDPVPLPRTLDNFAADLHGVLLAARVEPPYVLVGCSLGGMIVTHFASLQPREVCGLVLLDPPHPEINLRTLALLPPETPGEPRSLSEFRRLAWQEQFAPLETSELECLDFPTSLRQAQSTWNLRDIPVTVFTAGINEYEQDFPPAAAGAYEEAWWDLNHSMAALSSRSNHILVEDSDHLIHQSRPDLVLAAVRHFIAR
jgi:pimeloyl-ACP methyl ester carboxylesterase